MKFSFISCFPLLIAKAPFGTSLVIVEPAPIVTFDPIDIGATKTELAPVLVWSPISVICLLIPS